MRRLQKCDDMREHHLHEIHSVRGRFNVVDSLSDFSFIR